MEKFKKLILSDKILIGISVLCVLLLVLGYSFAWFNTTISGSDVNLNVSSSTKSLTFTDNVAINNSGTPIEPGWGESNNVYKTLVVQNNSSLDQSYNIVFDNLINSFVTTGFLQYRIDCVSGCDATYGTDPNTYVDIPKSLTASDKVIASNIRIKPGAAYKQTYNIYFRYSNSTTVDQSADMGKTLSGYVVIKPIDVVITNLVTNSTFDTGLSNWTTDWTNGSTTWYSTGGINNSGYMRITPSANYAWRFSNAFEIPYNHKYYTRAFYRKSGGGNTATLVYNTSNSTYGVTVIGSPNASVWTMLSAYSTQSNQSNTTYNFLLYGAYSSYLAGMYSEWDNAMVIDLTETFGAGNEPTNKAWCDANIPFVEGTKSVNIIVAPN